MKPQFDKEEFIKNYDRLKSSRKMGDLYQCDKSYILKYAKEINYNNHQRNKLTNEEKEYIIKEYYKQTAKQLSQNFNVSESFISKIWMENGLKGKKKFVYNLNHNYFEKIDTKDKAYFLGLLASDGCVYNKKNGQPIIRISLQSEDRYILETLKKYLETDKPLTKIEKQNSTYISYIFTLEIVSEKMFNDLLKYNITPNKTYKNIFPKLKNNLYSHFIRGFFDGDGGISISNNKNSLSSNYKVYITGFYKNLKEIKNILEINNIKSSFYEDKRKQNTEDKFGQLNICTNIDKKNFFNYIYKDIDDLYMSRKKYLADCFNTSIKK